MRPTRVVCESTVMLCVTVMSDRSEVHLQELHPRPRHRHVDKVGRGREVSALLAAAAVVGALLLECAAAQAGPPPPALVVSAVAFSERAGAGAALAELLRGALQAGGGGAEVRAAPPPRECVEGRAPDEPACLRAALAALVAGELHALLLPAGAGALPPPPRLREAGLETWGALSRRGDGPRRACYATGALRSLSELGAPAPPRALLYHAPPHLVQQLAPTPRYFCGTEEAGCEGEGAAATALVGPEAEARVLLALAARHSLRLQAVALGADWEPARALARLAALSDQPVLLCGRALDAAALAQGGAHLLGPPPCDLPDCPFDARPLHKLSAAGALAHSPAARAAFDRLALDEAGVHALEARAAALGPAAAARAALQKAGGGARALGAEVRVAVLVPLSTGRDAGSAHALRAAAELAEEDEAAGGDPPAPLRFKVELVDSGCAEARTLKYLTDALGSEFHALSAAFGGACALAFEGVARQSAALDLPAVSVAWRRRSAAGTLLAAGDGAAGAGALAALLAALGWRRVALLSEAGALPASGAAQALGAELAVTVELEAGESSPAAAAEQWAALAAARGARILLLACEDARAARAALCACERAGLTPERGAVFVVLGPLGARGGGWLAEGEDCARRQAEGALLLSPEWAARWREAGAQAAWSSRWRARAGAVAGAAPPAAAALLYDALRLWAAALRRLARSAPEALDDLHRPDRVTALISEVVGAPTAYVGLTGLWEWAGRARRGAAGEVRVSQWSGGRERRAGGWRGPEGGLALEQGALRWRTEGGAVPDDGAERCLWGLPCRWAGWVAGGAALLAGGALLAAGAWQCRRRAARDHRARLAAFGMRALPDKAGAPDRWELPRERLVINRKLGSGAFGAVYGGHALLAAGGADEGRAWAAVAVKTLKPGASTEQKLDFLSEAEVMKRFSHCCVVRLLGVVTRSEPVCTVMELMLYGDLKGYLVARRHLAGAAGEAGADVAPARLTAMARDAALGLAYLARTRYVHRDVAARNCLVDAARRVKLADFGMTRIVFDKDYYRFGRKGMLPVRWMAPESLAHGVFSPASDVWSFGVLLYEMVTFGALPYRGMPNHEALERAKAGRPPPLPPALEPQLEALIRSCWRVERRARPTAAALAGFLAEWPRLLTPCLAPPDALDEPLPHAPSQPAAHEVGWAGWVAPTSAGTDTTYLSAEPAPPPPPSAREAPDSASASDPFLPMSP